MKQKHGFPNSADFMYWTLRQTIPKWAQEFKLPMKCDIDGVVNSHAPKDERDPHYTVSNTLNTLQILRRSEGRYNPEGEMRRRLIEYAQRPYSGRVVRNYTREAFYGIFARRCLRKLNRQKPMNRNPVIANAIAYS